MIDAEYKLKIQFDLNMPFRNDPGARVIAENMIMDIKQAVAEMASDMDVPYPAIKKITLIDQGRRDGFNILAAQNEEIQNL